MFKFALALLLGVQLAAGVVQDTTVWTAVEDERCKDVPPTPPIPPTPGPTPFPDPPTPDFNRCHGEVTGFEIIDMEKNNKVVMKLYDGATIDMSKMPKRYTVKVIAPGASKVKMWVNDVLKREDSSKPFTYTDINKSNKWEAELKELYVKGTWKLKAQAESDDPDEKCIIVVDVVYGNPGVCQGIIKQFALWDADTNDYVPGYTNLDEHQVLPLDQLPQSITVVAVANGRGSGQAWLSINDGPDFAINGWPYSFSGKVENVKSNKQAKVWMDIREAGKWKLKARLTQRPGTNWIEGPEDNCEITIEVKDSYECPNLVSSLTLIDASSDKEISVMGYEKMAGGRVVELDHTGRKLTVRANGPAQKVRFWVNGTMVRQDDNFPYTISETGGGWNPGKTIVGNYKKWSNFSKPDLFIIQAQGWRDGAWEPKDDACLVKLRIEDDDPDDEVDVEDNENCDPALIVPDQEGDYEYPSLPVVTVKRVTNETISFNVTNTLEVTGKVDWITTSFVTRSGVEVCDKVNDVNKGDVLEHTYEAKCFDGMAYADVYFHSAAFDETKAKADTFFLPSGCRNPTEGKVVKYSFVFSCDCDAIPYIPDEIVPGVDPIAPDCIGISADVWGDPHINTWNGKRHWNCQEEGEFVMSKAALPGYDYDFSLHARFTRFGHPSLSWSFNSGMVVEAGVKVQLSMDDTIRPHSNMFANVPVSFYVDGQPRLLSEGSGDHRVMVTRDGYDVQFFLVETGIHVYVLVRPLIVDNHITNKIPGSMSTFLCFPEHMKGHIDDIMGMWGTPGGGVEDDYKFSDGTDYFPQFTSFLKNKDGEDTPYPSDGQGRKYCREQWCVTDAAKSKFTYEDGESHATFDTCNKNMRRRLEDVDPVVTGTNADTSIAAHLEGTDFTVPATFTDCSDTVTEDCLTDAHKQICSNVFDAQDFNMCLTDAAAFAPGNFGAEVAVESLFLATETGETGVTSDNKCCSSNYRDCDDTLDSLTMPQCEDAGHKWLPHGEFPFEPDQPDGGCDALGETCVINDALDSSADDSCCPGIVCNADTLQCEKKTARRKLTHAEWKRPDIPEVRNIVLLNEL